MSGEVTPLESPRKVLHLLRLKWSIPVMTVLARGWWRYTDLRESVSTLEQHAGEAGVAVRDSVFDLTLKDLLANGLIEQKRESDGPFQGVSYRLTPAGQSLLVEVKRLKQWEEAHRDMLATE